MPAAHPNALLTPSCPFSFPGYQPPLCTPPSAPGPGSLLGVHPIIPMNVPPVSGRSAMRSAAGDRGSCLSAPASDVHVPPPPPPPFAPTLYPPFVALPVALRPSVPPPPLYVHWPSPFRSHPCARPPLDNRMHGQTHVGSTPLPASTPPPPPPPPASPASNSLPASCNVGWPVILNPLGARLSEGVLAAAAVGGQRAGTGGRVQWHGAAGGRAAA